MKIGDLIQSKFREDDSEICLILEILNPQIFTVRRSVKRSYEKSRITHINPEYYKVIS
jgi:hypothetical protein